MPGCSFPAPHFLVPMVHPWSPWSLPLAHLELWACPAQQAQRHLHPSLGNLELGAMALMACGTRHGYSGACGWTTSSIKAPYRRALPCMLHLSHEQHSSLPNHARGTRCTRGGTIPPSGAPNGAAILPDHGSPVREGGVAKKNALGSKGQIRGQGPPAHPRCEGLAKEKAATEALLAI